MKAVAALFVVVLGAAHALPALAAEEISTDITTDLSGTIANDEDVVEDAGTGAPAKIKGPIAGTRAEMWVNTNPKAYQDLAKRYLAGLAPVPED